MVPCWKKKYPRTLTTISATVTNGKFSVGMLSLIGNTGWPPGYPPARRALRGCRDGTDARPALFHVFIRVIRRAHERAGRDVLEAEIVGGRLQRLELVRMPVAHDRQVALGRAQVLADGEHLDALLAQLAERVDHLRVGLPEADHEPGLGRDLVAAHRLGVLEHAQRALPPRAAARDRVQPRRDLDVVVEDVRPLGDDLRERHHLAAEVGRQHLDLAAGRLAADLADDADEGGRAVVGQVVAVHAGDDRVAQAHARDRARDARGLQRVVPGRLAGLDVAEAAAAGARVAEDHERRRAALPALAHVRARGLLADRVQRLGLDHPVQLAVLRPARERDLEPRRLTAPERLGLIAEHARDVHPARVSPGARLVDAQRRLAHGLSVPTGSRTPSRAGEISRCRYPNVSANRWPMRLRKQARPSAEPSCATEVMLTDGSPHATTHVNGARSLVTLTAKPCADTPREMC